MKAIVFTGYKLRIGLAWFAHELNILKSSKIGVLILYVALSRKKVIWSTEKTIKENFLYIPRIHKSIFEIFYLLYLQLKTILYNPLAYFYVLFRVGFFCDFRFLFNFIKLTKIISKIKLFNPDIIYTHYPNNNYILAYITSLYLNKKFGIIYHNFSTEPEYISYIHHHANFIMVKSNGIRRIILERNPKLFPTKIAVIPWGIDIKLFKNFKYKKEIKRAKLIIICISRFAEKKGLIYLLKACKVLFDKNINFQCVLIGYGSEKNNYKNYIEKNNLQNFVKICPPLPHSKKLLKFLSSADIFVLPSVVDSKGEVDVIPNACLEAMAMELPVITTRVGGMDEVITDGVNGFFVKEKDEVDLADKIINLMEMPIAKRREIGRKAREVVVERFDKEKQGKKFVEFLKSVSKN